MKISLITICLSFFAAAAGAQTSAGDPPLFTLDERNWVLFYDLPSRRFVGVREAFVRRDFATARRDLTAAAGFLAAELERADPRLAAPLEETTARLGELAESIETTGVNAGHLDAAFARAHWLLAQHYLVLSANARDLRRHRNAGHYLYATAHHMERAALWSNARLTPKLVRDIERLRTLAGKLQRSDKPENVYKDKPIVSAQRTLAELGQHLERRVWVASTP